MFAQSGDLIEVEAPNGEVVEGEAVHHIADLDGPFTLIDALTGEAVHVRAPWDCECTNLTYEGLTE